MKPHRFYPAEVPAIDEIVIAQITSITDVAVYCTLNAYGGIEAMMPTTEVGVKKHQKLTDYVRVGALKAVSVIRVDSGGSERQATVDVSLKQVRAAEGAAALEAYHRDLRVNLIVKSAASLKEDKIAELYRSVIWSRSSSEIYQLFESIKAGGISTIEGDGVTEDLVKAIHAHMPEVAYTKEHDIMIRFGTSSNGVARVAAELERLAAIEGIQVFVVAPPKYKLDATDVSEASAIKRLADAVATVPEPI